MKYLLLLLVISIEALSSQRPVPDAHAFKGWRPVEGYADTRIDWRSLPRVTPTCDKGAALYPTHPQQSTKVYHVFDWGSYNHFKLTGDSEACTISSRHNNSRGVKLCLRPDTIYYALISDLYRDACGQTYRAYWEVIYLKKNDNMGTLFAKGRTMYENPRSEFPGDYVMGPTYPLKTDDFLFFTPLFQADAEKIAEQRRLAERTHIYSPETSLFTPRGN